MKMQFALPLFVLLAGCLPFQDTKQVAVSAKAKIEVAPDAFRMSATLRSRADNQNDAMAEFSQSLDRLTNQLPQMEGLTSVKVEPSALQVQPVFERACANGRRYDSREACPIAGFIVETSISIEGSPAEVAGNVFSFASELGAEEVFFDEYFLLDSSTAERDAEQQAFEKAQDKARRLATSANVTLLGPIRISEDSPRGPMQRFAVAEDVIVVTGSRLTPRNILSITPPPITIEREVSVTFAIE